MVVTIDGPSGVGKSTVTRRVAAELGVPYLDTGAIYRAATLAVLRAGVAQDDEEAVAAVVADAAIDYDDGEVTLDGDAVTAAVRMPEVTAAVSPVSAIPAVRRICVALQRAWVERRGGRAVVEGRDIGSVVFPDAPVKVYLTAAPAIRAVRRAGDAETGSATLGEVAADLQRRDHHDSTRAVSPLRPADDAVLLDTGSLDIDQVVDAVLGMVHAAERRHED